MRREQYTPERPMRGTQSAANHALDMRVAPADPLSNSAVSNLRGTLKLEHRHYKINTTIAQALTILL